MKEEYDEEEHADDDDDDETTTHAIVIADENEHETENETAERTQARRHHRRRARRSRQDEEEEDDDEVQDVEAQRSRIPATGKSDPTHIDARCTYGREAGYQEEEEEGEAEGDQETLPQAHDQNLPLRSLAYRAGCRRDESRKLRHLITITITSPTRQWGSRDVYARPGDNVNTPRPVYGCMDHPMWLSIIRLSVLCWSQSGISLM